MATNNKHRSRVSISNNLLAAVHELYPEATSTGAAIELFVKHQLTDINERGDFRPRTKDDKRYGVKR